MKIVRLVPLVGLPLVLGAAAPAPTPPDAQLVQVQKQYQTFVLARDQMLACGRDAPGIAMGLVAARWEIGDLVKARYGQAQMDALGKLPKLAAVPCGSADDNALKLVSHEQALQYQFRLLDTWQAGRTADWHRWLADLPFPPAGLANLQREISASLVAVRGQAMIGEMMLSLQQQTELDLTMACEARKTVRSSVPRACPALKPEHVPHRAIGLARVETVEALGKWLADNGDSPFGPAFAYRSAAANPAAWASRSMVPCSGADRAVHPADPLARVEGDAMVLPVRSLKDGARVGEFRVKRSVLAGYPTAIPASAAGTEEFTRCPNKTGW